LKPKTKQAIERLKRHNRYREMGSYREVLGNLDTYIKQWENLVQHGLEPNLLDQGSVFFISDADQGYQDASMLCDGLEGFESDYHQGWIINSGEPWVLGVKLPKGARVKVIEMRFLNKPKHGILPPKQVDIRDGNQLLYTLTPTKVTDSLYRIQVEVNLPKKTTALHISIFKSQAKGKSTMALDEVKLIN